jgi:hypothetical protein
VAPSDEWQGASLVGLGQGAEGGYPRMSFASNYEGSHAGRIGPWKLFTPGSGAPRLSRAGKGAAVELEDVADDNPYAFRFVADPLWLLRAYNREWKNSQWGNPAVTRAAFPASFGE